MSVDVGIENVDTLVLFLNLEFFSGDNYPHRLLTFGLL